MKKCPFCAEEIQDEAIKCRFCSSLLGPPPQGALARAAPAPAPQGGSPAPAPFMREAGRDDPQPVRTTIYEGVPSWKAYFRHYALAVVLAAAAVALVLLIGRAMPAAAKVLYAAIPIVAMAVCCFAVNLYRRSIRFRVTSTAIELERGLWSKQIEVLPLWRCRDVRYRQDLSDRILGVARVEVFAHDATTPHLEIVGMPASRRLFDQLRDSIEIQRQHKNVYGVVS